MPHAAINGQDLYYEDTGGEGPPVVFSHGFLMDHEMFAPQVAELRDIYRVITWDERGFGATESDGQPFTYWDSARDVLALLDHLGIERAVLGGMSQGGFLSLRAALLSPDRVRALVLIDTQAGTEDPETAAGYRQMLDTWIEHGYVDEVADVVAGLIIGDAEVEPYWKDKWRTWPKERMATAGSALLDRDDVTDRLEEIEAPALVVHGTADVAIPLERAEALATLLPDCRGLIEVEGAAHAANLTHPGPVNTAMRGFLSGLPA